MFSSLSPTGFDSSSLRHLPFPHTFFRIYVSTITMSASMYLAVLFILIQVLHINGFFVQSMKHLIPATSSNLYSSMNLRVLRTNQYHRNQQSIFAIEDTSTDDVEETAKKYGLEAGLLKAAKTDDSKTKAADLLKKYGIAYLATSITLAIISYALCYFLVSTGVDVSSLLEKVGIKATATASSAGTVGKCPRDSLYISTLKIL